MIENADIVEGFTVQSMSEYGFSLTRIFPYSDLFYAVCSLSFEKGEKGKKERTPNKFATGLTRSYTKPRSFYIQGFKILWTLDRYFRNQNRLHYMLPHVVQCMTIVKKLEKILSQRQVLLGAVLT